MFRADPMNLQLIFDKLCLEITSCHRGQRHLIPQGFQCQRDVVCHAGSGCIDTEEGIINGIVVDGKFTDTGGRFRIHKSRNQNLLHSSSKVK
jgi:hypothetical protein